MSEVSQAKLDASLRQAFGSGPLRFCHDKAYRLKPDDRALCSFSQAELQRCPALKQQCGAAPLPEAKGKTAETQSADDPTPVAPWIGGVAEALFWVLIAGLAAAIVVSLWRMRRFRHTAPEEEPDAASSPAPQPNAPQNLVDGDTDVQRLLDKARRAAERGELGEAIDAAHAAAVQGLAASGHIHVDRDRTNGDYLRDLRQAAALQRDFKVIVGQVEVTQFGGAPPNRARYEQVLESVSSLLRRLAVLSLWTLVLSCALGCRSAGRDESEENSPSGLYTFKRLLADQGAKVHTRVAPLTELEDVAEVVVFSGEREISERDRLSSWVEQGGALIVVENDQFSKLGEAELRSSPCGNRAERPPELELPPLKLAVVGRASLRLTPDPNSAVSQRVEVRCGDTPYIVTSYLGDGSITYIPERSLLSNASLSVGDNAKLVAELFVVDGGTIELVGPWTGGGSESPIEALKSAGMLPVMLQLLGLALLLALRQGTSFGARRDDTTRTRRAFADHVRAVASTYARAGAGPLVSAHYGLLLLDQLRDRTCPGQMPTLLQLSAAISRRVGRSEPEVVELLVRAKSAFEDATHGENIDRELIRELERLSLQAGGVS